MAKMLAERLRHIALKPQNPSTEVYSIARLFLPLIPGFAQSLKKNTLELLPKNNTILIISFY